MEYTKTIRSVDLRLRGGELAEHTELEVLKNSTSSISTAGIEIPPRRRQPPRPKCGDIVVPDHTPNVLSAVLAVKEGGTIFVREGTYHWSEEDTGNETRSIDHNFGGQNDAANGRAFVGRRVTVRGEMGAVLWGRWVLLQGSSGRVRDLSLSYDMRGPDTGQSTLLVAGRWWYVRESDVRAALGTALALWGEGGMELRSCGVGGVDAGPGLEALEAVWCLGRAECKCVASTIACASDVGLYAVASSRATLAGCTLTRCGHLVGIAHAARVTLAACDLRQGPDMWDGPRRPGTMYEARNRHEPTGPWRPELSLVAAAAQAELRLCGPDPRAEAPPPLI